MEPAASHIPAQGGATMTLTSRSTLPGADHRPDPRPRRKRTPHREAVVEGRGAAPFPASDGAAGPGRRPGSGPSVHRLEHPARNGEWDARLRRGERSSARVLRPAPLPWDSASGSIYSHRAGALRRTDRLAPDRQYQMVNMRINRKYTLQRLAVCAGLTALATTIWAWAVGAELWHGAIIGAGLGVVLGIFLDRYMEADCGRPAEGPVNASTAHSIRQ